MAFLRLIRFPNLIIVALTQYLLQYAIIIPALKRAGISPLLDPFHFFLLCFSTIIVAATGYIINDMIDYKIDVINKPDKVIINRQISIELAKQLYWGVNIVGAMIALYLAYYVEALYLFFLFPLAVFIMYWYSKKLKKELLTGNLVVALFCAFVPAVILFAERSNVNLLANSHPSIAQELLTVTYGYALFAFLSTMFREIIKDIEDVKGDQALNCSTLPISWGIKTAKAIANVFALLLVAILVYVSFYLIQSKQYIHLTYVLLGIIFPIVYVMTLLIKATSKTEIHRLSSMAKYIMLSGLIYLIIYTVF